MDKLLKTQMILELMLSSSSNDENITQCQWTPSRCKFSMVENALSYQNPTVISNNENNDTYNNTN